MVPMVGPLVLGRNRPPSQCLGTDGTPAAEPVLFVSGVRAPSGWTPRAGCAGANAAPPRIGSGGRDPSLPRRGRVCGLVGRIRVCPRAAPKLRFRKGVTEQVGSPSPLHDEVRTRRERFLNPLVDPYDVDDQFGRLAVVHLPGADLTHRRICVVPRAVADLT